MIYGRKNIIIHTNLYQTLCLYIYVLSLVQLHMFYWKSFVDPYLWHHNQFLVILHPPTVKISWRLCILCVIKAIWWTPLIKVSRIVHNFLVIGVLAIASKLFEIFKQTHFIHSSRSGFTHGTLFMWSDPLKMTSHFMITTSFMSLSFQ